jgi:hypothetical protein
MPFDPCGRVMDFLRSCYEVEIKPFLDSNRRVTIRWYFTDEDAADFSFPTAFRSLNWGDRGPGVGEVIGAPRVYRDGFNFTFYSGQGHICGLLDWFENGAPVDTPIPNKLLCCGGFGEGGWKIRGAAALLHSLILPGEGGFTLTGEAALTTGYSFTGSGGTGTDGEGTFAVGFVLSTEGGWRATGDSTLTVGEGLSFVGQGGWRATGEESIVTIPFPTRATIFSDEANVVAGNSVVKGVGAGRWSCYEYQDPPANGDSRSWGVFLADGTYNFTVLSYDDANYGKVDWYIDGTLVVTGEDHYLGSGTWSVEHPHTGIYIAGSGFHVVKSVVNGKNASSSNYYFTLLKAWFYQVPDVTNVI